MPILACAAIVWVLVETVTLTEVTAIAVTLATAAAIYAVRRALLRRRRDRLVTA